MKIKINLDDLNPKFKIGQEVYFRYYQEICKSKIVNYRLFSSLIFENDSLTSEIEFYIDSYRVENYLERMSAIDLFESEEKCKEFYGLK